MTMTVEKSLNNFEFWGGAKYNASLLTIEELGTIENILESFDDRLTETDVNDFFWFEFDLILEWLELSETEIENREKNLKKI